MQQFAVEQHAAATRLEQAAQGAQQGGLAARVRSDDDGELSARDLDGEPVDDGAVVVADDQVLSGKPHRRLLMSR
ncbi:hypothetical protein GCM10009661_06240 [Catellatospora chokoriensis]|uniref:Uncharacterized protein n=1 Tax=Catellatospora chokoriensis TaxID=310353 RepID=A0A8J3JNT3_9ACTN|nr:hypothetical protein Cch02nite_18300 [Catellatospora chokoriensis]